MGKLVCNKFGNKHNYLQKSRVNKVSLHGTLVAQKLDLHHCTLTDVLISVELNFIMTSKSIIIQ